jgi:hypothetical protein
MPTIEKPSGTDLFTTEAHRPNKEVPLLEAPQVVVLFAVPL